MGNSYRLLVLAGNKLCFETNASNTPPLFKSCETEADSAEGNNHVARQRFTGDKIFE